MKPRQTMSRALTGVGALLMLAGAASAQCVGDCGGDREVTVDEIITMVNIALGSATVNACPVGDPSGDGEITVDEIVQAVNNALNGCPTSGCESVTVAMQIDFDENSITDLAGVTLNLNYPTSKVDMPNDEVFDRVLDASDAGGFFDAQDIDSNNDGKDDQLRVSYLTQSTILPGPFLTAQFDCTGDVPVAADFTCSIPNASDSAGFSLEGVTCSLTVVEP